MAQSRLERIGTIYSRIMSLLRGNAMKEEDKPLWLAIYAAFPPKYEPRFDRQLPSKAIKPIFYEEDLIRAFQKDQSFLPAVNLTNKNMKSASQNFLSMYKTIQEQEGLSGDNAYEQAMQQYKSELQEKNKFTKIIETHSSN